MTKAAYKGLNKLFIHDQDKELKASLGLFDGSAEGTTTRSS